MKQRPFSNKVTIVSGVGSGIGETGGFSSNVMSGTGPIEKERKKRTFSSGVVRYGENYHPSRGWY